MTAGIGLTAAITALEELADGVPWPEGAEPNVYRWWEPSMRLPAVWHWLTPSSTRRPDDCTVQDALRLVVSIGVRPGASSGEDAESLEALADAYVPVLDAALNTREFGGPMLKRSSRVGLGPLVSERLGDVTTLALEIPLELTLEHPA